MSYLLFIDESGHDHRNCPYEVRGGIALHAQRLWPFVQAMTELEQSAFGDRLHKYRTEIKGSKILDADRFRFAAQGELLDAVARRKHCVSFLNKGVEHRPPSRTEFTAYGQACLEMARGIFRLLRDNKAVLFASAIPRSVQAPAGYNPEEFLRKDHVFLLERFFYFLEQENDEGLLVLDETEDRLDRQFVRLMHRYYTLTQTGRYRTSRVIPAPFFVSSDMTYPVQAADVCMYCVNWGFRLPAQGMDAPARAEIQAEFAQWLKELEFRGEAYKDGKVFKMHGVVYVPDPYTPRT